MTIVLLVLIWVVALLVSLLVSHEPAEIEDRRDQDAGVGDPARAAGPVETRWTAWDDHQVARLLEDTPPS